jgi:hypothetical protein
MAIIFCEIAKCRRLAVCYFFCKLFHVLPLDGPTNVPVFMQEARAVSQFAAIPGWLAPADPLQLAAAALHDNALAGVMLPKSRSAIADIKTRMACFPPFCAPGHNLCKGPEPVDCRLARFGVAAG